MTLPQIAQEMRAALMRSEAASNTFVPLNIDGYPGVQIRRTYIKSAFRKSKGFVLQGPCGRETVTSTQVYLQQTARRFWDGSIREGWIFGVPNNIAVSGR